MKPAILGLAVSIALTLGAGASRAADAGLGSPGEPIRLQVGYMPYFSSTWSGAVMRGKKFYEKYLPAGSTVEFASALEGGKIAAALMSGEQQVGYLADVAAVQAVSQPQVGAVRLVAVLGLSQDQCSVLLVRPDAPRFASAAAAVDWLSGRTLAAPKGSCMERFARQMLRQQRVGATLGAEQNIEVVTAGFRAGGLDAAVVSEPSASRLVREGVARRVAAGANLGQFDGSYLAMRVDLIARRPDVAQAWLRAELEAQRFLADPAHAEEVIRMVAAQTSGFSDGDLWRGLYGLHSELEGGSQRRLSMPFDFTPQAMKVLSEAQAFLHGTGRAGSSRLPPGAVMAELAQEALARSAPLGALGDIRPLPTPAGWSARTPAAGKLSIRVDALGWDGGDAGLIGTVLEAVAAELVPRFPGRPLAPIRVSRSRQAPVALYDRGPGGEYRIELSASGADAGPYVYEFAHELCHVLSNYERHPHHAVTRTHQWFEEALCEVSSLYTLKTLGAAWQKSAPRPELRAAGPRMQEIAERFLRESHRRLPPGTTLAAWFRQSGQGLGSSAYDRDRNELVANLLLPLFEENPELWEAIGFLNLDAPGASFQQYLQNWLDNAPPRYHDVIRYVMTLFFSRESTPADAAAAFPVRPVEIIVTFGPGGGSDTMARKLALLLEPVLGVPVLVSNVPGASGNAGLTRLLLSADPDHTLVTLTALTAAAWAGGVGTVGPADFTVLGVVQDSPSMLFVAADSPWRSFREFLAQAKARPGSLRVATAGQGTLDDLTLALLGKAGFRLLNAPFAKPEERYEAALARRTDALFEEPGDVASLLASGRLRPLVAFSDARLAEFKDVPASREFGLAIGDLPNFRSLAMSAATSKDKVKVLVDALSKVLDSAEWKAFCAQTYSCTAANSPLEAKARVQALVDKVVGYREGLSR